MFAQGCFGSNRRLVAACLRRHPQAWEELLGLYKDRIHRTIRKALGRDAAAQFLVDDLDSDVRYMLFGRKSVLRACARTGTGPAL